LKNDELIEQSKEIVKRKRNRPDLANFGAENAEPGDNARYIRQSRISKDLPPIDISDAKQVDDRIDMYLDFCEETDRKPSIIGLANWLGISRDTLNSWANGEYRASTHSDLIKKVRGILEENLVELMLNGKVNPPNGIFLLKNHFGYKDAVDIVPARRDSMGELKNIDDLQRSISGSIPEEVYEDGNDY